MLAYILSFLLSICLIHFNFAIFPWIIFVIIKKIHILYLFRGGVLIYAVHCIMHIYNSYNDLSTLLLCWMFQIFLFVGLKRCNKKTQLKGWKHSDIHNSLYLASKNSLPWKKKLQFERLELLRFFQMFFSCGEDKSLMLLSYGQIKMIYIQWWPKLLALLVIIISTLAILVH